MILSWKTWPPTIMSMRTVKLKLLSNVQTWKLSFRDKLKWSVKLLWPRKEPNKQHSARTLLWMTSVDKRKKLVAFKLRLNTWKKETRSNNRSSKLLTRRNTLCWARKSKPSARDNSWSSKLESTSKVRPGKLLKREWSSSRWLRMTVS